MGNEIFEKHYEHFLAKNERRMNGTFCKILWYCCLVGPIIAFGVFCEAFPDVTYSACIQTLIVSLAFAIGHTILYKRKPESLLIKYIGLIGTLLTIYIMCINHIGIYLSYFFVPMTSLLYCNRKTFMLICSLSYVVLLGSNWQISEYTSNLRTDVDQIEWFTSIVGGQTIEFLIMFLSGFFIIKLMEEHLQTMYCNEIAISKTEIAAYTDDLTGLWNRRYLERAFDKYFVVKQNRGALLIVDLDFFKDVNDKYGHLEGDRALKTFSGILHNAFANSNALTLCRYGGDEFVVLLPGVETFTDLSTKISNLISNSEATLGSDEHLNKITLSIGAAFIKDDDSDFLEVFDRADQSLLQVKRDGRNSFQVYQAEE